MISFDEWIHRGLEYAWKSWECRSENRAGGGAGVDSREIAIELRWLDLAIDSFSKAGSSGQCLVSRCLLFCSLQYAKYESQLAGDEYVLKAKLNRKHSCFLNELQKPTAAASIQQAETKTERNGIKLVAACIKEGMWLETHDLASLLPLKSVTNLDGTECIFGINGSSLRSRLEVLRWKHRQSPLPRQNKSTIKQYVTQDVV